MNQYKSIPWFLLVKVNDSNDSMMDQEHLESMENQLMFWVIELGPRFFLFENSLKLCIGEILKQFLGPEISSQRSIGDFHSMVRWNLMSLFTQVLFVENKASCNHSKGHKFKELFISYVL